MTLENQVFLTTAFATTIKSTWD